MKTLFFIPFLFSISHAYATGPSVLIRTEVSPKEIEIGDRIHYRVTVIYSTDVAPLPLKPIASLGEFELINMTSSQPEVQKSGKFQIQHELILTVFSTGSLTIPGLSLTFSNPLKALSEAKTEDVPIKVKSLLEEKGDEGRLRPLKGLFNVGSYLWLWILLSGIGGVLLIYLIWRWVDKRRNPPGQMFPPTRPPEEVALEAIEQLETSGLIEAGQFKEFYFRLSAICRQYLENRYSISALEKTTSELLGEFRRLNLSLNVFSILRDFFEVADLVKFAKFTPTIEEISSDVLRAKETITPTPPQKATAETQEVVPV